MTAALTHAGEQRIICAMSSYPASVDLTGKLVFLERENPSDKNDTYNDGEYLVLHASASSLIVLSTADFGTYGLGGGLTSGTQLALVGERRYLVVSVADPDRGWIFNQIDEAEAEIEAVRSGAKKADWIGSVYSRAEASIQRIRRVLSPFPSLDGWVRTDPNPAVDTVEGADQVRSCFTEARRLLHEAERPDGYDPHKVHLALQWRDLGAEVTAAVACGVYDG